MSDTSGFYKVIDNNLYYGPNFVLNQDYELRREIHSGMEYPIDGWMFFLSEEAAREAYGLLPVDTSSEI